MHQVIRVKKLKTKNQINNAISHNLRLNTGNLKNIDESRTHLNEIKFSQSKPKFLNAFDEKVKAVQLGSKRKIRKDAVKMLEFVITASPTFFENNYKEDIDSYLLESQKFIERKFGKENILSLVIHRDEKTPHIHILLTPIVDGKFNAKKALGGPAGLSSLQTNFNNEVAKPFGLKRGEVGSSARHQTIREYHTDINFIERENNVDWLPRVSGLSLFLDRKKIDEHYKKAFSRKDAQVYAANQEIERLKAAKNLYMQIDYDEYQRLKNESEKVQLEKQNIERLKAEVYQLAEQTKRDRAAIIESNRVLKLHQEQALELKSNIKTLKNKQKDLTEQLYEKTNAYEMLHDKTQECINEKERVIDKLTQQLDVRNSEVEQLKERNFVLSKKSNELEERLNPSKGMDM
jgi:hypothetical protein